MTDLRLTRWLPRFLSSYGCAGSVEEARASYIIRDFEKDAFEARKAAMQSIADKMNQELGSDRVT